MADAIRCKRCGRQETTHLSEPLGEGVPDKIWEGYRMSLTDCCRGRGGFVPDDPKLARKLAEQAEEE